MPHLDLGPFHLRVVNPDDSIASEVRLNSRETAIAECDRIQRELKADQSLARAFVYGRDGIVPIAAGLEHPKSRKRGERVARGVE